MKTRTEEPPALPTEKRRWWQAVFDWFPDHMGTVLGFVLLVLGGVLTATAGDSATASACGAVLLGLSGIVISVEASTASGARKAERDIGIRTSALTRQFGSVTFQIQTAVENVYEGQLPHETALEMIYQCVVSLHGLTKELETVGGDKVIGDITAILSDAQELADSVRDFTAHDSDPADIEQIEARAELLSARIDSARGQLPREIREEVVDCPNCGSSTKTAVGTTAGDSGVGHCSVCGLNFHSHRARTGGVFSRRPGTGHVPGFSTGTDSRQKRTVDCPTNGCENQIAVPHTGGIVERVCLNCLATLRIDASAPEVLSSAPNTPVKAALMDRRGMYYMLECPGCRKVIKSIGSRNGRVIAVCNQCSSVLSHEVPEPPHREASKTDSDPMQVLANEVSAQLPS